MQLEKVEINPRKSDFYLKGQINFNCKTWLFVLAFSCSRLSFFPLVLFVSELATKAYNASWNVLSNVTKITDDIFPFTGFHGPRVFCVHGFYDFCLSAVWVKKLQKNMLVHFIMIKGGYCTLLSCWLYPSEPEGMNHVLWSSASFPIWIQTLRGLKPPSHNTSCKLCFSMPVRRLWAAPLP